MDCPDFSPSKKTSDKKKGVDNQPLSLFSVGITGYQKTR
nr:MAG TPA: hypothetical protein [Caudoviricetes sp.]